MNRQNRWMLFFFLTTALGCGAAPRPLPPPKVVPAIGSRVELAAGDVWLETGSGKTRIITGEMMPESATLSLDPGARVLVRLTDGTGIFVRDNSIVEVTGAAVALKKGEMWVDVPSGEGELKRFISGAVTVTAAGAGFDVAAAGDHVEVYVARGLAIVNTDGGRTEVESGEKGVVKGAAAPMVEPVKFFEDWTGGMADQTLSAGIGGRAAGRIYGIDRQNPGTLPYELDIQTQEISVVIRDGIAHTTVDQRFFNPASVDVEGWYWFTIPEDASVERFALEVNGYLVEGEMTERKQAAEAYEEAVQSAMDPALLEWIDGRTFRARIFPIPTAGDRRVVLSYTQFLPFSDDTYRYVYPMGGKGEKRIQEFALHVDLGDAGRDYEIATLQEARIDEDNARVSIRRSGYVPKADFLLELKQTQETPPLRAYRFATGRNEADYLMVRYAPEVVWSEVTEVPGDVVIVVDTSAGGGETERQIRSDAASAILRALAEKDRFAVVSADLKPKVVFPEKGRAPATEEQIAMAEERLSEVASAGATDLGEMFHVAFDLVHDAVQPAVVYIGDGRPTVGETGANTLAERLRRSLGDARARLFTIAVGDGADHGLLERLARMGGGRAFRIDAPEQTVQEALRFAGLVKTPTITDLKIDLGAGLDQAYATVAGKVSEGEEVVILARSHHELPKQITVTGRLGGKPFERRYKTDVESGEAYGYIPSLWARMYLERLLGDGIRENRGAIISLGLSYYLMTPYTSFLVLESDEAYAAAGLARRDRQGPLWDGFKDAEPPPARMEMKREMVSRPEDEGVETAASEVMDMPEEATAGMSDVLSAPAPAPSMKSGGASTVKERRRRRAPQKVKAPPPRPKRAVKAAKQASETDPWDSYDPPRHRTLRQNGVCSDAAKRPLLQRRLIWMRKLERTKTPSDWADLFFNAASRCELPRSRARKTLLALIEQNARTGDEIRALLDEFAGEPKLQRFLRKRIIRRSLNTEMNLSLYYEPGAINWIEVRRGLGALKTVQEKIKKVRELLETNPDDAGGQLLLIELLIEADQKEEALAMATRLRRDELAGPYLLEIICDLQAETGNAAEARRTCSELVEFSEADPAARKRLGDLFLRHGWFESAYRQYKTLVDLKPDAPTAWLRLASAAAGMGKVDEALRIERKVSTFDGESGPTDPRRYARLHSALRIAKMIREAEASNDAGMVKALTRRLKRTQTFNGPATLVLLAWHDLEIPLALEATEGKKPATVSDRVSSTGTGLTMVDLGQLDPNSVTMTVKIDQAPIGRDTPFSLMIISFDGDSFNIKESNGILPARSHKDSVALKKTHVR